MDDKQARCSRGAAGGPPLLLSRASGRPSCQSAVAAADPRHRLQLARRRRADLDHRGAPGVDGFDDFDVVDALQVDRRDPEVAMPELPLDDDQRGAFTAISTARAWRS
jgi:hypothetical protein